MRASVVDMTKSINSEVAVVSMIDETFDCFELPGIPGGLRASLTYGIARYLGIVCIPDNGRHRQEAMKLYPEAYCRLVKAVAEEARRMMEEGVPPFGGAADKRGDLDEEPVEIRLYAKNGRFKRTMIRNVSKGHAEEIFEVVRAKQRGT